MARKVLILGGSGKIGTHSAHAFRAAGWQVQVWDRTHDSMEERALGCDVIVNGLNPPNYHNWAQIIPEITQQVISAAKASGATVIVPGNVYNFGTAPGIWSQATPQLPETRKGRIRVEMERAYKTSGVQTIILRAGNFIDPDSRSDILGSLHLARIRRGKIVSPGKVEVAQAWCYLPDWAKAAVQLAERRQSLARFEDVPFPGHNFSVEKMQEVLQQLLGKKLRVTRFPWWSLTLVSPFWELARELKEMRYLWNLDHRLCAEKFELLLPGFRATDLETVIGDALPADIYPDQPMPDLGHIPAG